jgi:hypothetical protein
VGDVDHAAERVVFRRGAASGAALVEAAELKPLGEALANPPKAAQPAPPATPAEPAAPPNEPAAPAATANEPSPAPPAPEAPVSRALGATALVTAGLAVVAGLGAALVRGIARRR